ncbi:MAG TPA: hypothetical protein VGC77_07975 [Rhodopseudomonas sp.]|uniref:hypothetical protein n=1 Tax=Rhodopseudomonas sp. TaxID=1078 RepID=UPI002EDAFE18
MTDQTGDDPLLQLRRLATTVRNANRRDSRRRLLALESQVRAVRGELSARCRRLVEDINAAGAHISAINAYARCASLGRGSVQGRANGKVTGN